MFLGIQSTSGAAVSLAGIVACVRIAQYLPKEDFDIDASLLCARCNGYVPSSRQMVKVVAIMSSARMFPRNKQSVALTKSDTVAASWS